MLYLIRKAVKTVNRRLWNKDFVLLLQGRAVSSLGDVMYSVAIGYWVYNATGSSALMGIMTSISMFVTMFLSPFCGSIVDKANRKWLIVAIDTVQGALMLAVGVLAFLEALSVPVVLVAALLASFGSVFYSPAINSLMLDIIPRDDMVRGQSLNSGVSSLIDLTGSAISGAMVAFLGVPLIIVINGISNLYSALTEAFIHNYKSPSQGSAVTVRGLVSDMLVAAKIIFSEKCLRVFVLSALILNLLSAGPLMLMMPSCLEKGFPVDMYGYVVSIFSLAYVVGALALGAIKLKPRARFWVMSLGFTLSVPAFLAAYFSEKFYLLCIFAFLSGLLNCAGNTVFNAALMLALPKENRNAILGFISAFSVGGTAISAVIYGLLGEFFPLHLTFAVGTAISFIPMLYLCFTPSTKRFILENCE